jgi:hypothetical protein
VTTKKGKALKPVVPLKDGFTMPYGNIQKIYST